MTPDPVLAAALREAPGLTALEWLDMALEAMGRGEYDLAGLQLDRCRAAIARSARPEGLEERGDMTTPCQADAFCYRSHGHGGDHAYALHSKDTGS